MKERTCTICLATFANKTHKENHRNAIHPREICDELEDDDLDFGEVSKFGIIDEGAVKIIRQRNGLYLMQYDEYVQWLSLAEDNAMVKEFWEDEDDEKKEEPDELPLITRDDIMSWLQNKVISADYVVENDFFE